MDQQLLYWVNLPGEPGSVITMIDGHKMALAGRGGPALAVAAIGSFFCRVLLVQLFWQHLLRR